MAYPTRDGILFHNVGELFPEPTGGLRLQRTPEAVRLELNEMAQARMLWPWGIELRTVPKDNTRPVRLTLRTLEGQAEAWVQWGQFAERAGRPIGTEPTTLELNFPDIVRECGLEHFGHHPFKPQVCRVLLRGDPVVYLGAEGDLRPPEPAELPPVRLLAYGTSITQGVGCSHQHLSYIHLAARELGWDVINLGSGGSALCDSAISDYMQGLPGWEAAFLCLSVNMVGRGLSVETFTERVTYMLERLSSTGKPILCMSILPYFGDFSGQPRQKPTQEYRAALPGICRKFKNVHFVAGPDILMDVGDLTVDMIHPSDFGMLKIARNLVPHLRALLPGGKPG